MPFEYGRAHESPRAELFVKRRGFFAGCGQRGRYSITRFPSVDLESSLPMDFNPLASPPLMTAELPGIGGRIKVAPEDFDVEEIPAYEPSGSGDFLYLWVEKRAMGADYFVRLVARRLEIPPGEVGTAGLKDRHAVTRQWVSVTGKVADRVERLNDEE